jgi:hypothetical protein
MRAEHSMSAKPRPLTKAALEELGDARLLLDTVTHNVHALVRAPADPDPALAAAIAMLEQALRTLARIRDQRAGIR